VKEFNNVPRISAFCFTFNDKGFYAMRYALRAVRFVGFGWEKERRNS
jgi:hypothetical protein